MPTLADWQALWEGSELQERVIQTYPVDSRQEIRDRIQWIGWRCLLPAWGWALRLYLAKPAVRQVIKKSFDVRMEIFQTIRYALLTEKKEEDAQMKPDTLIRNLFFVLLGSMAAKRISFTLFCRTFLLHP